MIEARNVHYQVANKTLIESINLSAHSGETFAILGSNGAGKSTLLKCLSASFSPQKGGVFWDGNSILSFSGKERAQRRAVLSQKNEIGFPFKVIDIVLMGRYPHHSGEETSEDHDIAEIVLRQVDIYELKDRSYTHLSGGERQRVHLARALAQIWTCKSPYLFLDEPTTALDLKHQQKILEIVTKLKVEKQASIICILHDINLALMYADRTILLKEGKSVAYGAIPEVLTEKMIEATYNVSVNFIDIGRSYPFVCLKDRAETESIQ